MASQLTDLIRKKYPGQYDDMDDATLEKAILAKYPEYKDLTTPLKTEPVVQKPIVQEEKPGILGKIYNTIFEAPKPITDFAHSISQHITDPNQQIMSPTGQGGFHDYMAETLARLRGFEAGATEGLANLASPANLLTLGRGKLPQLMSRILGGGQTIHGVSELSKGNVASGLGDIGMGIMGLSAPHGNIPEETIPIVKREYTPADYATDNAYIKARGQEIPPELAALAEEPKTKESILPKDDWTNEFKKPVVEPEILPKTVTAKTSSDIPTGTIVTIKPGPDVPTKIKQANSAGFEFDSMDDKGNFRFKKTGPIMEGPTVNRPKSNEEIKALEKETGGNQPPNKPPNNRLLNPEELDPDIPIIGRKSNIQPVSKLQQAYDLPRGLMSVDLPFMTSAAFRQASPLAWTSNWFKAWGKAASGFKSEDAYNAIMNTVKNNKYAKSKYEPLFNKEGQVKSYRERPSFTDEVGLSLTDLGNISKREEQLRSQWAEQIPGYGRYVKASNRAYTAFLNDLRINKFSQLIDEAKSQGLDPEKNLVLGRQIADFVNSATGRGKLEIGVGTKNINLEQNTKLLTNLLFSPRLMASRVKFLNPSTYIQAEPMVRKEFIKGLARSIGTWGALAGLAEMAGAQVSKDPNNADFGKIRIDNTRIDPGSGFQQYLVLLSRMGTGKFTSSTSGKTSVMGEGYKPRTRLSTAEEFMANKLHPVARLAYDIMNAGRNNPVSLGDRTMQLALPMFTQDLMQAAQEEPELGAIIAPLSSVGFGTQSYEPGSFGKPVFIPPQYDVQVGGR